MFGLSERQKRWWCRVFGSHWAYDCDEVLADEKKTIEVAIWHQRRLDAAYVVRDYAEAALEEAYGHKYNIDVWIRKTSLPGEMSPDEVFGHIRDRVDDSHKAKDANCALIPGADNVGGGSVCIANSDTPWSGHPDIGDLRGKPVERYKCGSEVHDAISSALHEVGHCLGLGHDHGGKVTHETRQYVTVMPYSDIDCLFLGYGEDTIESLTIA